MPGWRAKLRFFGLSPMGSTMSTKHAPLLVGLQEKLSRVRRHWALVDEELLPAGPLVLLWDVGLAQFGELCARWPESRQAVDAAELEVKLARAAYERCKEELHEWLRAIRRWMRAYYQETDYYPLVPRMPVRGASFKRWHQAALKTLAMWKAMVADPPEPLPVGDEDGEASGDMWEYPVRLYEGAVDPFGEVVKTTVQQFEEVVRAFEAADAAMIGAEIDLQVVRGTLARAQGEATALLMAYGHGVQARLGNKGALVRSIPQVWPKHKPKRKAA